MNLVIESGLLADIDELERLYDNLNDYLSSTTNYPGWIKGIYPIRENAVTGIQNNNLFIAKYNGEIVGSIILDHQPEEAYHAKSETLNFIGFTVKGGANYNLTENHNVFANVGYISRAPFSLIPDWNASYAAR